MNLMDTGLFIYLPRDLTKNKKGPVLTNCHTKHIAILHGLWPSVRQY